MKTVYLKIMSVVLAVGILSLNAYSITVDQIPEYVDRNEALVGSYADMALTKYARGAQLDSQASTVVLTIVAFVIIRATPTLSCSGGVYYTQSEISHLESILKAGNNEALARQEMAKLTL